jgi:hypothetical protein
MKRMTALAVFALAGLALCAADSSCVQCHTDSDTMKSLFVPPEAGASEGEG